MKNKLFRVLSVFFCVVMLVSMFAFNSSALSVTRVDVPELSDYYAYHYLTNSKRTVAFFETVKEDDEGYKYVYTKNGVDFEEIDFMKYAPECDFVQLVEADAHGDLFVFFFVCYDIEYVYDDVSEEYYDEYIVTDSYFITTKDFVNFEKSTVKVQTENEILCGGYGSFDYYGLLEYIDGEWVFANGDYIVTEEIDGEQYGKGVYYTTNDFKTWEAHYTQEDVVCSGVEFYFVYYPTYGTIYAVNEYSNTAYLMLDDGCYGAVEAICEENEDGYYDIYCLDDSRPEFLRFETVYTEEYLAEEEEYADFRVVHINAETGEENVLYEGKEDFYIQREYFNGHVYFFVSHDGSDEIEAYELTPGLEFKPIETTFATDYSYVSYYQEDSTYYECFENKIIVYEGNLENSETFSFGKSAFTLTYDMFVYELNGMLYILETDSENGKSTAYRTDIDVIKNGDVNCDKMINSSDALSVLQHSAGIIKLTDYQSSKANVNNDDKISSSDALTILQFATGIIDKI